MDGLADVHDCFEPTRTFQFQFDQTIGAKKWSMKHERSPLPPTNEVLQLPLQAAHRLSSLEKRQCFSVNIEKRWITTEQIDGGSLRSRWFCDGSTSLKPDSCAQILVCGIIVQVCDSYRSCLRTPTVDASKDTSSITVVSLLNRTYFLHVNIN